MSGEVNVLHVRFMENLAVFGLGSATVIVDLLQAGTVLIGFLGAVLAAMGGWEAWRAKKTERKIRELELHRKLTEDAVTFSK